MNQNGLYEEYCIDTCSILDFWRIDNSKIAPYHVKVKSFRVLWDYLTGEIEKGRILVPKCVAKEINTESQELQKWLSAHDSLFIDDNCQNELKEIIEAYNVYTTTRASLTDAMVVATSKHRSLTVITSEHFVSNHSNYSPKIPNVCKEFSVNWVNLPNFFEAEGL